MHVYGRIVIIIILRGRMEESESDEEIFITQNSFRENPVDLGFDISRLLEPEDRLIVDKVLELQENDVGLEKSDLCEQPEPFSEERQVVVVSDDELRKRNEARVPVNIGKHFLDGERVGRLG